MRGQDEKQYDLDRKRDSEEFRALNTQGYHLQKEIKLFDSGVIPLTRKVNPESSVFKWTEDGEV